MVARSLLSVIVYSDTLRSRFSSAFVRSLPTLNSVESVDFACVVTVAVADPGFPRGGTLTPKGGRQPIIWPIFPENCMKMKKFGAGGARPSRPP